MFFEDRDGCGLLHKERMLSEIQILLYIFKRYFKDIVGSSLGKVLWISFGQVVELLDFDIEFWSSIRMKGWL